MCATCAFDTGETVGQYVDSAAEGMKTAADSNKISAELLREDKKLIENIKGLDNGMLVYDKKDRPVILVNNERSLNWILERNPGIQFLTVPADVEKI